MDLTGCKSGSLDGKQEPAPDDMTVGAAQATEEGHHTLSVAQREVGFQNEVGMPAGRGGLEALVPTVGHLEEQQQGVREHHGNICSHDPPGGFPPSSPWPTVDPEFKLGAAGAVEDNLVLTVIVEVHKVSFPAPLPLSDRTAAFFTHGRPDHSEASLAGG